MPLPEVITKMPPKRLAIIAGAGIGAGLLWRHYANKNVATSTPVDSSGAPVDMSQYALAENSAGNLSAGGSGGGLTTVPNSNDATRGLDSFLPLPITKYVTTGQDGVDYYAGPDGGLIGPVNTPVYTQPVAQPTYTEPAPVAAPAAAAFQLPSWLNGIRFLKGSGPAVYAVTPNGLEWVPSEDVFTAMGGGGSIPGYNYQNPNGIAPVIVGENVINSLPKVGATP